MTASGQAPDGIADVDGAQVIATLSGGGCGFISLGRYYPAGDAVWAEAFGTWAARYASADDDVRLYGMRRIRAEHPSHPYAAQWWPIGQGVGYGASFANQVADLLEGWPEAPWTPGFRQGAAVQAVCDAMETSAASGRWVRISEVNNGVTSDVLKPKERDHWPGPTIIGGGVMGLMTAYHAAPLAESVTVLDRSRVGDPAPASVPGADRLYTGVGWRGMGYKFAPWVGRVLAELALRAGHRLRHRAPHARQIRRGRGGFMSSSIMDRLRAGTVLGAEGYVFELERRGYIKAGPFVPEVVLDFPDAVRELHREFLRAGADVMVALTYYAHREKLRDVGREGDLEAMNRQAVRIAREVAREGDALVAGNVCNTWAYDPGDPATKRTVSGHARRTAGLGRGGGRRLRHLGDESTTWARR